MNDETPTGNPTTLGIDQIKRMIPHREPFLMIDEVLDVKPDVSAIGIKNVTEDEPYFEGHFPGHPIMPGVLIIEAMAQTAAVLVMATTGEKEGSLVYFMSVDQARFRRPVFPGDRLCLHVAKQKSRGNVWKFRGEARVNDELKAEAVYSAMIVENK